MNCAVIRRAVTRVIQKVGRRRVRVTADRGFADVALFTLLTDVGGGVRDPRQEEHQDLYCRRVAAARHAALCGQYAPSHAGASALLCREPPTAVGDDESEAGYAWQVGHLVFGGQSALYGRASRGRICAPAGCEAGFRDAKWWLGFAQARIKQITAWSRLFALCAIALLVVASLATRLLLRGDAQAAALLRRVASRRRGRCELSLVSAMISLLHQDQGCMIISPLGIKLKLEGDLANVS